MADDGRISIKLQLGDAVNQLKQLRGGLQDIDTQAVKTNKSLSSIRQVLGHSNTSVRETRDAVRQLVSAYSEQTRALNTLVNAQNNFSSAQKTAKSSVSGLNSSVMSLVATVVSVASAWKLFQTTLGRSIQIDSLTKTFYAIQGSMSGAAIEMNYVRSEAQRLGLDFTALAESFKGFSAATKFANFDLATTKDMFSAVSESATVLGLSGEKTKLVLMALEQMVSKGVVSMEELRRQLGDSLPGAFELGAKAMGMGLAEFNKFVASGKLMSEEFLPKFTKTLRETYGTIENVGLAVKTPRAEIQKLMNELFLAQDHFARAGFLDTVVAGVRDLTAALQSQDMQDNIAELGRMFGVLVSAGMTVVEFLISYGTNIVSLASLVGILVLAEKAWAAAMVIRANGIEKSGVLVKALVTTYGMYARALYGAAAATRAFSLAAAAATLFTGGLVAIIASLVIPKVLDFVSGFSDETKVASDFAKKFGGSVEEAEAQIARFLVTLGKPDPLAPFTKSINDAEKRLEKLTAAAEEAMKKASASAGGGFFDEWMTNMSRMDASMNMGMSEEQIEKLLPSKALTKVTKSIHDNITGVFADIKDKTFTHSFEIMARMQQIKKAMDEAANDPAQKASLKTLEQSYKTLAYYATDYANTLDRINQDKIDKALAANAERWSETLKELGTNMSVFQAAYGERFGKDYDTDMKNIDGTIKRYEKLWAASAEGKKKSQEAHNSEVRDMAKIIGLKENQLDAELIIKTAEMQIVKTAAETKAKAYIKEQEALLAKGDIEEEQAVERILRAIAVAEAETRSADQIMSSIKAQTEAAKAGLADLLKNKKAIEDQQGKENNKGVKKDTSGKAAQSKLQDLQQRVLDAEASVRSLTNAADALEAQLAGDTQLAETTKALKDMNTATRSVDKALEDAKEKRIGASGALLKSIDAEIAKLQESSAAQKEQIQRAYEYNLQLIDRKHLLEDLALAATYAERAGDVQGAYAAQITLVEENLKTARSEQAAANLEQEKALLLAKQNMDIMALAAQGGKDWMTQTWDDVASTFMTTIPNAFDTTTDAFSTMFADIVSGSLSAKDAFTNFSQTMQNLGNQILQMIVKIIIQWTVMKAVTGIMDAIASSGGSGGATATNMGTNVSSSTSFLPGSTGSVNWSGYALGGAFQGGREVTAFASGGVLNGPHVFPMANGGIGVAGEAGPEAFVPLGRTREGKLGIETTDGGGLSGGNVNLIVHVYNNASDQVSTRQEQGSDENGNPKLDVFIDQIESMLAGRINSGKSAIGKSIDRTRGTNPAKAMYV